MKFGSVKIGSKRKGGEKFDESFFLIDVDRKNRVLGNPHILHNHLDDNERAQVIEKYRVDFEQDCANNGHMLEETKKIARRVYKGQNIALMCWCSGPPLFKPCHAEIIKNKIEEILKPYE
jgi:hypothetical protein